MRPLHRLLPLLLAAALPAQALTTIPPLQTLAENSGFQRTGRYAEVIGLCDTFARVHPEAVQCGEFGTTPEGRPMKHLVITTSGATTPALARERGIPVVLVQGGIHAGEIDGKDAGFLLLRQMFEGGAPAEVLDKVVWVFVPVFNVDGHERFGAWNRPNQRGPVEMGWRVTAQNLNLNRDYAKADSPEMQAMLALVAQWDPLAVVDLHATDGAQFEHDISITAEPVHAGDDALRAIGTAWRDGVIADLAAEGHLPVAFYPSFNDYEDPASGFTDAVAAPRFSTGYFWLRNRLGMLVETHSWRPYPQRVLSTRNTVLSVLQRVAANGPAWLAAVKAADTRAAALASQPVPLVWTATDAVRTIDFRGYAYTRTPSEISGAPMTRYDESTPTIWKVPLRDVLAPTWTATAPAAGYVVPAAHAAWVGEKLRQHGIEFRRLDAEVPGAAVETFRADTATFGTGSLESHQTLTVTGAWKPEAMTVPAGSLFVPIAQPKARLVLSLLEPQAPDSLLAWGRFNAHFERKEYMEAYVAEAVAREMLAKDPALQAEFDAKLAADPEFAKSPDQRLEFFYRRHTAWDEAFRLYPVMRTATVPR